MALRQEPVLPNPGSRVIAFDFVRSEEMSMPNSPSVPMIVGNSYSFPSRRRLAFPITFLRPVAQGGTLNPVQVESWPQIIAGFDKVTMVLRSDRTLDFLSRLVSPRIG